MIMLEATNIHYAYDSHPCVPSVIPAKAGIQANGTQNEMDLQQEFLIYNFEF